MTPFKRAWFRNIVCGWAVYPFCCIVALPGSRWAPAIFAVIVIPIAYFFTHHWRDS